MFGIATSAENFYDKLPRDTVELLDGQVVDLIKPQQLFEEFLMSTVDIEELAPRLGPEILSAIASWQSDYIQSVQGVMDAFKVCFGARQEIRRV